MPITPGKRNSSLRSGESRRDGADCGWQRGAFCAALNVSEEEVTTGLDRFAAAANTLLAEVHHDGHSSR